MVQLIRFPKPHMDFEYIHEQCAECLIPLTDERTGTEIVDAPTKTIMYLCHHCSTELSPADLQLITKPVVVDYTI
ncbi:hypothetical protein [Solibacillus sp. NPDC093137]|uniref:hypothetical protein n=1 Tax=Solibacillus sp. NPDC093137 TaxID=3390678 RepID=UPI003D08B210